MKFKCKHILLSPKMLKIVPRKTLGAAMTEAETVKEIKSTD